MANRHRGEISGTLAGREYTFCLTLGALADLEDALADEDIFAFVQRLSQGRITSRDVISILGAGLRGAGHAVSNDEVAAMMPPANGFSGALELAARLISSAFAINDETR